MPLGLGQAGSKKRKKIKKIRLIIKKIVLSFWAAANKSIDKSNQNWDA